MADRSDQPPSDPLPVHEAQARLLSFFAPLETELIPLGQASGRVLAEEVVARYDLPPFPNSSMDGFAVRAADVSGAAPERPVVLEVVADIPAGRAVDTGVSDGQAARIMTGAVLPDGADAVVPVEDTGFNYRQPGLPAPDHVQIFKGAAAGENVRPQGQDVRAGEAVMEPGGRVRPQDTGFLSMLGISSVPVHRRPRVAIFSTGDELLPVEAPLAPGKIHDANSYALVALAQECGAETLYLGIAADTQPAVEQILEQTYQAGVDLILSSAGVSVGAFDFVRTVVEGRGRLDFWRVNMRPGKPLAFGHYRGIPFIGLPGNPVSAYVGFEVFVRPAILKLSGMKNVHQPVVQATLLEAVESDGRESYLRAIASRRGGELEARLTGHQGSGNLRSLVQANALLIISSGVKSVPAGAKVDAWLLGEVYDAPVDEQ